MNIRNLSIQRQWQLISILLVMLPVLSLSLLTYLTSHKEIYSSVEQQLTNQVLMVANHIETALTITKKKLQTDIRVAHKLFYAAGQPTLDRDDSMTIDATNQITQRTEQVTIPVMKIGGDKIAYNSDIVDKIRQVLGDTVTIFQMFPQGALRISTNVLKSDGNRAVGTYIPNDSDVYTTVMKGETFFGRAQVVDDWYQTAYEPIRDREGHIIGMLYVGMKDVTEPILDSLAQIVIGKTGYIWILNRNGEYVLSLKRLRDGENIASSQDSQGRYFVKTWLEKGPSLGKDEAIIDYYPWQNTGERFSRDKIVAYTYFPELEWIIGSGMYVEDFSQSLKNIWMTAVGVSGISIVLGLFIAYRFVAGIAGNFTKITQYLHDISAGNLLSTIDMQRQNELGGMVVALDGTKDKIHSVLQEIDTLIQSIQQGQLMYRGNVAAFEGAWRDLVIGVNTLIGAFVQPISVTIDAIDRIAHGDITQKIAHEFNGDFNEAKDSLNAMVNTFSTIVGQVKAASDRVAESSEALSGRSAQIARGVDVQATTAEEVSTSMEEMLFSIKHNAGNALQTKTIALKAAENTRQGSRIVLEAVQAMRKIAKKISIVEDIALQTRMLSLNATIEAAKAQDHGKGFAVVATEVRALAERSRIAAEEIRQLANSSVNIAEQAGEQLAQLVPDIENTARLVEEISVSTTEQSTGAEYINHSVQQLDHIIQQNTTTSEEIAATADLLAEQAKQLQDTMAFFKMTHELASPSIEEISNSQEEEH